jgi:hypothetical protein
MHVHKQFTIVYSVYTADIDISPLPKSDTLAFSILKADSSNFLWGKKFNLFYVYFSS